MIGEFNPGRKKTDEQTVNLDAYQDSIVPTALLDFETTRRQLAEPGFFENGIAGGTERESPA